MNEGEFINAQFQKLQMDPNSFFGIITRAAYKADLGNKAKLMKAFPDLTESVTRWQSEEGYAEKLLAAYKGGTGDIDGKRIE